MVEGIATDTAPRSRVSLKERASICRLLQLVLLVSVEGCLIFAIALESRRGLFHFVVAAFPLVSIFSLLVSRTLLGPPEAWRSRQSCSWPMVEIVHDVVVFALLLPSAVALLVPPFSTLEASAAVLTLVVVLAVALHGVENLQKSKRRMSSPLVAAIGSRNISNSCTRRPRRVNSPSSPSTFSLHHYPRSTPVQAFPDQQSEISPLTPGSTSPMRGGSEARDQCSNVFPLRKGPAQVPDRGGSGSPPVLHPRVGVLRNSEGSGYSPRNDSTLKFLPLSQHCGEDNSDSSSNTTTEMLSQSPKMTKRLNMAPPGLRFFNRTCSKEENDKNATKNQTRSFGGLPIIELTEPTPESRSHNRVRESEMGASPVLQNNDAVLSHIADSPSTNSQSCRSTDLTSIQGPKPIFTMTTESSSQNIYSKEPHSRNPLMEELSERFLMKSSQKNITSLKSLEEYSPPKTFFSDSSKQQSPAEPCPAPRKVTNVKSAPQLPLNASLQRFTHTPSSVSPRPSPRTVPPNRLPSLPPSTKYTPVYPISRPYHSNIDSRQHLPQSFPQNTDSSEGGQAMPSKFQIHNAVPHNENSMKILTSEESQTMKCSNQPQHSAQNVEARNSCGVRRHSELTTDL